jgi:hypothetical protein
VYTLGRVKIICIVVIFVMIIPMNSFILLVFSCAASPPQRSVQLEAIEMRSMQRLPHRLDSEYEGDVRDVEW